MTEEQQRNIRVSGDSLIRRVRAVRPLLDAGMAEMDTVLDVLEEHAEALAEAFNEADDAEKPL